MNHKEIEALIKMLKKHGVEEFEHEGVKLKINPINFIKKANESLTPLAKSNEKVTEDDLYYSASALKPRIKHAV